MKKTKQIISMLCALAVFAIPITLAGCSGGCASKKLDPSGEYKGDQTLYTAEAAIVDAEAVLHAFVTFEFTNREALSSTPQVKAAADSVRANAKKWTDSAIALRDAYVASPTPANRDALTEAVRVLREAITQAQGYVKAGVPKK